MFLHQRRHRGAPTGQNETVSTFVVARNPDEQSTLPYLLNLPIDGGIVLKARDTWPRTSRVYCHPAAEWPASAEVLEEVEVSLCRRRGAAVDLVLQRPRLARSQFVFTEARGRPVIFWQTQRAARRSNPGGRIPSASRLGPIAIDIDSRERYPFRFPGKDVSAQRSALPAGDYGVRFDGAVVAVVERKSLEDLVGSLADGKLAFQLQKLAEQPVAAIAVEGRYSNLLKVERSRGAWLADMLARLQVRYPEVQIVFADSRKFAEDWTYRFLASALADAARTEPPS